MPMFKHLFPKLILFSAAFLNVPVAGSGQVLAYSQSNPATSNTFMKPVKLGDLLTTLRSHYNVDILYADRLVKNISIAESELDLKKNIDVNLHSLLVPHGLTFKKQKNGTYLIVSTEKRVGSVQGSIHQPEIPSVRASSHESGIVITVPQQNEIISKIAELTITGRVKGKDSNEDLPGVSVVLKGTQTGTITDEQGRFSLDIPDHAAENGALVLSFVGYESMEIPVLNKTQFDILLTPDLRALEEVVVVGYGTQKRKDLTGAVHSIDNTKNETLPNTNVIQALRGTVPGVSISAGGNAGSGNAISIRGQNSLSGNNNALIVVDGIIYAGQLGNLNPNDIASIEVLKDASSAAIFGAKAANGVVLITTKKGSTEKPTIQFNSYAGTQDLLMTLEFESPEQYVKKKIDYQKTLAFRGVAPQPDPANPVQYLNMDEIENFKNGRIIEPLDRISQAATIQSYNLNIGAKTNRTTYYLAGSYTNQQGKVIGDQFKRTSLRLNLETNVTDWLKFGTNSSFSFVDVSNSAANLANAFWLSPYATWYLDEEEKILNPTPMTDGLVGNPLMPTLNSLTNNRRELFGIFYGELSIPFIEGLTYRVTYSNNYINGKNYNFTPSFNAGGVNRVASSSNVLTESQDVYLENLVKYNRAIGRDHVLDLTFLYNYNVASSSALNANANTFPTDLLNFYSLNLGENQTTSADFSDYRAIAMMGRINYKFKDKYLFTLTGRRDGASVFSANHKFAFFPSMALGWIISDEDFLSGAGFIDLLKIRASYGANGNQGISRYGSLSRIETGSGYNYLLGGNTVYGVAKTSMGNKDLKWETTYASNIGVDFGFFNNRLSGNLNLYNSDTKDLIVSRTIPTLNGFSSILSNIGSVNNKGIELMVSSVNFKQGDWEWTTSGNFARNVNKIMKLYGEKDENGKELDDISNRWFIGKSVGAYYNYSIDGVWQIGEEMPAGFRPGDYKIKDLNGDGKITQDGDRAIIGYDVPSFTYGFNTSLRYKNINLFVQLLGSQGGVRNNAAMYLPTNSWSFRVRDQHLNWWTPENPTNELSSLDYQNGHSVNILHSTSFLRVQDISLSYDLPSSVLGKLKMSRLQIYASAKNPFLMTSWTGWDPETTGSGRGQYPSMKSITAGINLSL